MKSKIMLLILFNLISHLFLLADQRLASLLMNKNYTDIAKLFTDESYQVLQPFFKHSTQIAFDYKTSGQTMFYAKFANHAEVGLLVFKKQNHQYSQLILKRLINPLYFVEKMVKYDVQNCKIRMGDATLTFQSGQFYKIIPFNNLFLFLGHWHFHIRPNDKEERYTLKYMFKQESFSKENRCGIFLIQDPDFHKQLTGGIDAANLMDPEATGMIAALQEEFGIPIKPLSEYWYLSFSNSLNLAFFPNTKKSIYKYYYNKNMSPDTILLDAPENRYVLSYNVEKSLKFGSVSDHIEQIKLNFYFNPNTLFLSGTSVLQFQNPSDLKKIELDEAFSIKGYQTPDKKKINFLKKGKHYYILGENIKEISLYYTGKAKNDNPGKDAFMDPLSHHYGKEIDHFYLLGDKQVFFPKSGEDFFKSSLTISLPGSFNCLATGHLVKKQKVQNKNILKFTSNGSRNLAVIYGDFKKVHTLDTLIPLNIFSSRDIVLSYYFKADDIKKYFDFLTKTYGDLYIPELNVLFRRWQDYGGVNHNGFIIFNLANPYDPWFESNRRRIVRDSPVVVSKHINRDNLIHELAHQWWGDLISWKTFREVWILEGGAQFSTLLYLESILSEREFSNLIEKKVKNWVIKNQDVGPIIYGRRIANLTNNHIYYQSIIYNKSALVLFMLRELLGKDEFYARIKNLFKTFKYKSISTRQFIQFISQKDPQILKFLQQWIYSRTIPTVKASINIKGTKADIFFSQKESAFIFPLTLTIKTSEGTREQLIVINQKEQRILVSDQNTIRSIKINSKFSPVQVID